MSSKTQYTYAVARIRALEVSLFSASTLEQLLACKDMDGCLRFLQERGWGDNDTPMAADAILSREEEKIWETIREMHVDMSLFDVLLYTRWFHNLKAAIKSVCTGREVASIFYEGTPISKEEMLRIIKERDYRALPASMQQAAEEAMEVLLHSGDGQLCDVIIDRAAMEAILAAGQKAEDDIIKDYAESTVAVSNIKIAVRAARTGKTLEFMKRAMAPCDSLSVDKLAQAALGGMDSIIEYLSSDGYAEAAETLKDSQAAFERWCDNRIIEAIKPQKMNPFSAGPLVAYVIARENEIKTVRIILTCKQNGMSDDSIRERIREMYV
ncbi:V-type ATPase subunit [Frisingicoccus sp.]|uniref:V-type ATPase subunit n=1 Tax=Frisingicoccus sp. TaxID=1918627 RepID=UPI002EC1C426|nr:V-type ATPase subunit [Frisingicoccus sp.]